MRARSGYRAIVSEKRVLAAGKSPAAAAACADWSCCRASEPLLRLGRCCCCWKLLLLLMIVAEVRDGGRLGAATRKHIRGLPTMDDLSCVRWKVQSYGGLCVVVSTAANLPGGNKVRPPILAICGCSKGRLRINLSYLYLLRD